MFYGVRSSPRDQGWAEDVEFVKQRTRYGDAAGSNGVRTRTEMRSVGKFTGLG